MTIPSTIAGGPSIFQVHLGSGEVLSAGDEADILVAFWEDRYHATAVQDGDHLIRCLVYIDLNMVRTGFPD